MATQSISYTLKNDTSVMEYARGDVDGDGFAALLLRRDGSVQRGSYARTNVFLLMRTPRTSV
jgi:hypothetical protein